MNKKLVGGVWVPKDETHLVPYLEKSAAETGVGSYQLDTIGAFLDHIPFDRRGTLVDIGGHVGLWSMRLCRFFDKVVAYEPIPIMQECFELNVFGPNGDRNPNVSLRRHALGDQRLDFDLVVESDNSGHTHILPTDAGDLPSRASLVRAQMKLLDDDELENVDTIKIDVEGFEPAVLRGAENTIRRFKPIICMEQKPHNFYAWEQFAATKLLMAWGAKPVRRVVDDYIFVWD